MELVLLLRLTHIPLGGSGDWPFWWSCRNGSFYHSQCQNLPAGSMFFHLTQMFASEEWVPEQGPVFLLAAHTHNTV